MRSSPRRRPVATALSALALAALPFAVAACGDDGGSSGPTSTSPPPAVREASCESVEPGGVVGADLAVVYFDTEGVCPGWVTVEQGTQVTFTNRDVVSRTVTVRETQLPDAPVVVSFEIGPGASQPLDTRTPARMGFVTDALPGFRGTIEVVPADGSGGSLVPH